MSVAFLYLIFCLKIFTNDAILTYQKRNQNLVTVGETFNMANEKDYYLISCFTDILNKYYSKEKVLTYVDMDFGCNSILKTMHSMNRYSIVSRDTKVKLQTPNEGYVVTVKSVSDFTNLFFQLTKEARWDPTSKFTIIFKLLNRNELKEIFDLLLKTHVTNVLIINGTKDADLYTYNPFENYACGKYYSTIISYGKCLITNANLFPVKLVTGLRECTFNVAVPHWPPYSIDPSKRRNGMTKLGVEQYVMQVIAEKENFKINYTFTDDAEEFSTINFDMSASGPMKMLQDNKTDAMLGGLILVPLRADAFQYLYCHLDYSDELRILVKRASLQPAWKNFYLEFENTVWITLLLVLILFSILMVKLLRVQDTSYVVLRLFDSLLLHGNNLRSRLSVRCVLLFWIWFTYLINCFYQSNLMSLTTKPSTNRQISDTTELFKFGMKPCLSFVMTNFIKAESLSISDSDQSLEKYPGCKTFLNSIKIVTKSELLYTIVIYSIYTYNKHQFYDKWGYPLVYSFKQPVAKVMNAIYLYKGFPLQRRLHLLTLRMKENGLVQNHLNHQYFLTDLRHHYQSRSFETRFAPPWYLYSLGCFASFVVLVIECSLKR